MLCFPRTTHDVGTVLTQTRWERDRSERGVLTTERFCVFPNPRAPRSNPDPELGTGERVSFSDSGE